MARRLKAPAADPGNRFKVPLNPSVRGTGKQSLREQKGIQRPTLHRTEGTGAPPGHGRGGKVSRSPTSKK